MEVRKQAFAATWLMVLTDGAVATCWVCDDRRLICRDELPDWPTPTWRRMPRHSFASFAADLRYNEPTIAPLPRHKTHSITSRYVHCADVVLLVAADVVANFSMKLMAVESGAVVGSASRWISHVGEFTS